MPTFSLPRESGILLHPTSLPGPHGSGDFGPNAYHFIDWLAHAGQRYWQILPLTPVGPGHSPYSGASAFAGNPLLIALEPLIERGWLQQTEQTWPAETIDFARLIPWRQTQLYAAWQGFLQHASAAEQNALTAYIDQEKRWLEDYALFALIDSAQQAQGRTLWTDWPPELARRNPAALAALRQSPAWQFHAWQQWCFDQQWQMIQQYAANKGIALMGDVPIFVAHHSADVWAHQDLFDLDYHGLPTAVAGVPPDYFSATGQRWGNPLYAWEKHAASQFAWWQERLQRQCGWTPLIRLDHFRGFAANWRIPARCPTAVEGDWQPGPGAALFNALTRTLGEPLPFVAEDLGLITDDVRALRETFYLPGMKILQFAFSGDTEHEFLPHNYQENCVVYTGTHDNNTSVGWWSAISDSERKFASQYLCGETRDLSDQIHRLLWVAATRSRARLSILPMQDALGLPACARMNTPGQLGAWGWRFTWSQVPQDLAAWLHAQNRLSSRLPRPAHSPS